MLVNPYIYALVNPYINALVNPYIYALVNPYIYALVNPYIYALINPYIYALVIYLRPCKYMYFHGLKNKQHCKAPLVRQVVVEAASGASVYAAVHHLQKTEPCPKRVGVILCGGNTDFLSPLSDTLQPNAQKNYIL